MMNTLVSIGGVTCRRVDTGSVSGTGSKIILKEGRIEKVKKTDIPTWGDKLNGDKKGQSIFIFENWDSTAVTKCIKKKLDRTSGITRQPELEIIEGI